MIQCKLAMRHSALPNAPLVVVRAPTLEKEWYHVIQAAFDMIKKCDWLESTEH